uniref:Uncharacterized protein n=1 Tax=Ciona savignyi TaxID=51511 RepID=H2Y737_CIOSA
MLQHESRLSSEQPQKNPPNRIHLTVRRLTRGGTFGVGCSLYTDQPQVALVSNGAECLMLSKKLFWEHVTEQCLDHLRQKEYPYPNDEELLEQYWRLRSWKAYQSHLLKQIYIDMYSG